MILCTKHKAPKAYFFLGVAQHLLFRAVWPLVFVVFCGFFPIACSAFVFVS